MSARPTARFAGLKRAAHRAAARLAASVLRPGGAYDPETFRFWERRGLHVTPNHFYFPVPDTRTLAATYRPVSELPGIDLRLEAQIDLLHGVLARHQEELVRLATAVGPPGRFSLDNDAFTGTDPFVLWGMLRWLRPARVIEVGSGHSTLLGAQALRANGSGRWQAIDPFPGELVAFGIPGVELLRRPVETADLSFFAALRSNDILFIDSSHVARTGGDVTFLLLEVVPRLPPGVVVHVHDVFLPYDYPPEWLTERLLFWTEQYLLQAYLADNPRAEVLFASHYASRTFPDELRRAFPRALGWHGGSFWLRKV